MSSHRAHRAKIVWVDRAVAGASALALCWLLGPGIEIVNGILGPVSDPSASLPWLEQLLEEPEAAFVRLMCAVGLVVAVRLIAGLLLALAARLPGRSGIRAAWLSYCMTPPFARRYVHVLISIGLSSWSGALLSTPALAATQATGSMTTMRATASVVPAPVLAPPEATLQTWPDLGRTGTNVPSSPSPSTTTLPSRPPSAPHPQPSASRPASQGATTGDRASTSAATPQSPAEVVVAPGDCLWTLAERDLASRTQTEPSASDIAVATQRWWQANRTAIGDNADQLMPGQRLQPPV